jgi:hypothetical protein
MTLEYDLKETDFITHQLFIASKSERIKKRRRIGRILFPLIYIAFAVSYFFQDRYTTSSIFIAVAILWYWLYPIWERSYYKKHYMGFVKENYKERLNKTSTVEISNDFVIVKDSGSEGRLSTNEIEGIYEIPMLILIKFKIGNSIIIPKEKITNLNLLVVRLKDLARHLEINYNVEEKWKWK